MREQIRTIVETHIEGGLSTPELQADLWDAGLTSLGATRVLMDLEDHFDVEFTADLLGKSTFASVDALHAAVISLTASAPAVTA